MIRSEKEITEKTEIESIIQQSVVCRLAFSDGQNPYIVPLCFGYINDTLYFHSAKEGKKLDILRRNSQVCFEFDIGTETKPGKTACDWGMAYQSVIGFGQALMVEDVAEKRKALELITSQYADKAYTVTDGAAKETLVFKVEISSMTGKKSG
jgi:nitroimidazol reductase NimA-like FMN-containing flavoprotein (pyridoxamine 5'-phosphate oxidase superfamily)